MTEKEQPKVESGEPKAESAKPEPETEASRDMLTRLADAGEDAVRRFGEKTGLTRVVHFADSARHRLDEAATRLKSVAKLETRVAELEEQVAALTKDEPKRKQPARSGDPSDAKA
jgi:uncharacterized small protein (DUF1192 family)